MRMWRLVGMISLMIVSCNRIPMTGKVRVVTNLCSKIEVYYKAIQDIGMGQYNWELFVLCGLGWFADKCVLVLPLRNSADRTVHGSKA